MSTARAYNESPRKDGPVRILVIDASPSCRISIATPANSADDPGRVEVVRGTSAALERGASDTWDLILTHLHEPGVDENHATIPRRLPSDFIRGRTGIFRKLFRRGKLSPIEQEERRATRTVLLAEIQREVGVAISAVEMGDFDTIGEIALRLKDDGANYNFAKLSGLGAALHNTVPNRDIRTARNIAQKLMTYMGKTIGHDAA